MQRRPYSKRDREQRSMVRQTRLRELGYDTYSAYLRSPAWRDVKMRYRASDLPQICMCGETTVDLHHTTYQRVGRELLEDLVPLCRACHEQAHVLETAGVIGLDLNGFYYDMQRAYTNAAAERVRKKQAAIDFAAHDPVVAKRTERDRKRAERGRNFRRNLGPNENAGGQA